jgi:chromate transport protein ChrA
MDIKEAKRKKRNQVLQTFIVAMIADIISYYIIKNAPAETTWELIKYIFSVVGYGWPISSPGIVIIVGCITTLLFLWELKEYLEGNYQIWRTGKSKS